MTVTPHPTAEIKPRWRDIPRVGDTLHTCPALDVAWFMAGNNTETTYEFSPPLPETIQQARVMVRERQDG